VLLPIRATLCFGCCNALTNAILYWQALHALKSLFVTAIFINLKYDDLMCPDKSALCSVHVSMNILIPLLKCYSVVTLNA